MKILKKIALAVFVAVSLGGVSTTTFAESDPGRITYPPSVAIDMVIAKIQEASNALNAGNDTEAVSKIAKEALDISKEVNANDKVDAVRSKGNNAIKAARNHIKNGDKQQAEQEFQNAKKVFKSLKSLI